MNKNLKCELSDPKTAFFLWAIDGNVIYIDGYFSTQCAQYRNKLKTLKQLYKYFLNEFESLL